MMKLAPPRAGARLDRTSHSMDLVAATVDASHGVIQHAILDEDFANRRASTRRVVFTEDVAKIAVSKVDMR
jgi:hypothetical protein